MGVFIRRAALGCALTAMMALALGGVAQAATWAPTVSLADGRYNHTATVLADGRVLVAGGSNRTEQLDSAQVYDPATNTWSATPPMTSARSGLAAVALDSGEVLVAGGNTDTAELYDPTTNGWRSAGVMSEVRSRPTMTLLEDGRVLVAGGAGNGPRSIKGSLKSADIYDPAADKWTPAPDMSTARRDATATLLPDGDVLLAGGWDGDSDLDTAELYHPDSGAGTWSPTGSLSVARDSATATTLQGGDVLVVGGGQGIGTPSALASVERYDHVHGTWSTVASMAQARVRAAATLLDDNTVLVAGGIDPGNTGTLATAEDYDAGTDTWTPAGSLTAPRERLTLSTLPNGRALAVGGNPAAGFDTGVATVERFSLAAATLGNTEFNGVLVGTSSGVATATFTNTGPRPITITGVTIGGASVSSYDIPAGSDGCTGQTVAANGGTCQIGVRFTPAAAGNRSASLIVADDSTAAGSTTATLHGVGTTPPSPPGSDPGSAPAAGGTTGAGAAGGGAAGGAVLDTKSSSKAKPTRATCSTKATRSHGRTRSTVTCKVTWPNGSGALTTRLMRGKKVVATTRSTAKAGKATLRLTAKTRLKAGRYTLVVAKRDGTVVLRQTISVR